MNGSPSLGGGGPPPGSRVVVKNPAGLPSLQDDRAGGAHGFLKPGRPLPGSLGLRPTPRQTLRVVLWHGTGGRAERVWRTWWLLSGSGGMWPPIPATPWTGWTFPGLHWPLLPNLRRSP